MVSKKVQFSLEKQFLYINIIILKTAVATASNYLLSLLSVFLCYP